MDLENLALNAGDATSPPPANIPPQKVPGWIRWPLRAFFLPFVLLDVAMQKFARILIPPPYVQKGECKKRGNCCYYIMIRRPKGILGWFFLFWNTEFQGFYPRSDEVYEYEGNRVMVMGCRYLQKDGSCNHYKLRPMVCRKWPVIQHFGRPRILKGCGFRAEPKKNKLNVLKD